MEGAGHTQVRFGAVSLTSPVVSYAGATDGAILSRKVVPTDASLTGWGGIHEGRSVSGC